MGFINMFRLGICSSWEDYPGTKDAGLWIHHFAILHLIHPFFINVKKDDMNFIHHNSAAMVSSTTDADIEFHERWYKCYPRYSYVWLGIIHDGGNNVDTQNVNG